MQHTCDKPHVAELEATLCSGGHQQPATDWDKLAWGMCWFHEAVHRSNPSLSHQSKFCGKEREARCSTEHFLACKTHLTHVCIAQVGALWSCKKPACGGGIWTQGDATNVNAAQARTFSTWCRFRGSTGTCTTSISEIFSRKAMCGRRIASRCVCARPGAERRRRHGIECQDMRNHGIIHRSPWSPHGIHAERNA